MKRRHIQHEIDSVDNILSIYLFYIFNVFELYLILNSENHNTSKHCVVVVVVISPILKMKVGLWKY